MELLQKGNISLFGMSEKSTQNTFNNLLEKVIYARLSSFLTSGAVITYKTSNMTNKMSAMLCMYGCKVELHMQIFCGIRELHETTRPIQTYHFQADLIWCEYIFQ